MLPKLLILFITITTILCTTKNAHAYLDPGAGSAFLQAILATIVAGGVVIKVYWYRILAFFSNKKDDKPDDDKNAKNEKGN